MADSVSNLPETNAEWKRQKNLENLAKARVALKLKLEKEKQKLVQESTEPTNATETLIPLTNESEPQLEEEPYYVETNKEEPKGFFWAEPRFRMARKRLREQMLLESLQPEIPKPLEPIQVVEPPAKIQKTEESFWSRGKSFIIQHASDGGKIFLASFCVLVAQSMAKKAHEELANRSQGAIPKISYQIVSSKSKFLNPSTDY